MLSKIYSHDHIIFFSMCVSFKGHKILCQGNLTVPVSSVIITLLPCVNSLPNLCSNISSKFSLIYMIQTYMCAMDPRLYIFC